MRVNRWRATSPFTTRGDPTAALTGKRPIRCTSTNRCPCPRQLEPSRHPLIEPGSTVQTGGSTSVPLHPNHTWSADFMADALWSGRRFRTFNVNDDYNRESLRIEIDTSLPSQRVIRALDELVEVRGAPQRLRLDNGPEFISAALKQWAKDRGIELVHIQPGKPTQNAYIERFNKTYRTEVLDCYLFTSLNEVRRMTEDWRHRYNHERPHRALGGLPPVPYAMAQSPQTSTSE